MRPFTAHRMLFNGIRNTVGKRLSSTASRSFFLSPKLTARATGLTIATSVGIAAPWLYKFGSIIYNDAVVDANGNPTAAVASLTERATETPVKPRSRFGGKLDYRQLCIGSIFGLVLGVVVGKISTLLVYVTAVGFLCIQWLQNRGMIDKDMTGSIFARYIVKTGRETIDFNTLVWERPSFKISFLLTFLLAAANI
ncbi:hypothetical protein HG536_0F03600 [Torulaspora globosa]|uniref:FUN14 domain-containing protein n=1 Tax=Torulaspora globosa TaxID=48254 RepID=A0A7G3ZKJ9_9SACH|nr:uncharacterized protein HG536_0F03600 [Torulaspora globosa]QLL34035.1 hypothetical protein HG536_0F03600 [Torulaspora globosa]